jgi:hypothetical protein
MANKLEEYTVRVLHDRTEEVSQVTLLKDGKPVLASGWNKHWDHNEEDKSLIEQIHRMTETDESIYEDWKREEQEELEREEEGWSTDFSDLPEDTTVVLVKLKSGQVKQTTGTAVLAWMDRDVEFDSWKLKEESTQGD